MCVIIHKEGLAHFPIRGTQAWPRACPERSRTPALFRPPTLVSLPHMEIAAIQTHGLTRRFGALTAVDDVTLSVAPGQFFGFLGPNGAGKSTTIKMLTGLLEPSAGTIDILGQQTLQNILMSAQGAAPPAAGCESRVGTEPFFCLRFPDFLVVILLPLIDLLVVNVSEEHTSELQSLRH